MEITNSLVIITAPCTEESCEFTSYLFYDQFLPELSIYREKFMELKNKDLFLDFRNVKKINPLVLPNLLCVGLGLKNLRHIKTSIKNLCGEAASMLCFSNFKYLAETEGIYIFEDFDLNTSFEWGNKDKISIYLNHIKFPEQMKNVTELEFENNKSKYQCANNFILDEINETDPAARAIFNSMHDLIDETSLRDLAEYMQNDITSALKLHKKDKNLGIYLKSILECAKNSIMHGHAGCFIVVYSYKLKSRMVFGFAVSDIGYGIPLSIKEKYKQKSKSPNESNKFIFYNRKLKVLNKFNFSSSQKEVLDNNYAAILEAIFYRAIRRPLQFRFFDCGLFDIIQSILNYNENGKIRIHSDYVQVVVTNNFYNKNILPYIVDRRNKELNWEKLSENLREYVMSSQEQKANIRITNKFSGTHLEFEFEQGFEGE